MPKAITSQKVTNFTSEQQTKSVTVSGEIENEKTLQSELGIMLGVSASGKIGMPFVAQGEIEVSTEITTTVSLGTAERSKRAWSDNVSVNCGPGKTYKVAASARQATFDVPFVATWKSRTTDVKMTTTGIYNGTFVYDFDTTWGEV